MPILLLDEPFSGGLDPGGLLTLKRIIQHQARRKVATVVLTSPVPELVEEIATRVVVLRRRRDPRLRHARRPAAPDRPSRLAGCRARAADLSRDEPEAASLLPGLFLMAHRVVHRLRQITVRRGRSLVVAAIPFLLLEGLCRYLESKNIPIALNLGVRPGYVWLFAVCVIYGLARVAAIHPIWNSDYQIWLESTPWTFQKSLPLGPVELVWEDGLIVGLLILLSATLPHPHAVQLLCAFLLSHLFALTVTLFLTGTWAIGYAAAFALGLPVWLWRSATPLPGGRDGCLFAGL